MDKKIIPFGKDWLKCSVCGRTCADLSGHHCQPRKDKDSGPSMTEVNKEWNTKGRAEYEAAQKKGGWHE